MDLTYFPWRTREFFNGLRPWNPQDVMGRVGTLLEFVELLRWRPNPAAYSAAFGALCHMPCECTPHVVFRNHGYI